MTDLFSDAPPAFLSTGAVARLLGLTPDQVRAMVDIGQLPRPQWMSMGRRTERVYSQEWVVLAGEELNAKRLEGLESWIPPEDVAQFAIRVSRSSWTLAETIERLSALDRLWRACMDALDVDPNEAPTLQVRRLSAGSPLDVLIWIASYPAIGVGVGVGIWLMRTAINSPEKLSGVVPNLVAGWHNAWADVDDARARRTISAKKLSAIEDAAIEVRGAVEGNGVRTAASGALVQLAEIRAREIEGGIEADEDEVINAPSAALFRSEAADVEASPGEVANTAPAVESDPSDG